MENLINDIVFNEIKLYPSPKYKKSIPTFLSKNQIEEIIKKIDSDTKGNDSIKARNKALIMLFFTSGLRETWLVLVTIVLSSKRSNSSVTWSIK